ncbi:glycerophosphodiester phosphodiesterase family protein [Pectobacterium sp. A5351]|uniref:glycerophosphodiester phosphodiesterase family protein n=1 Tax=Pectobacterium sp. A5351 TaxID=2914983 RepID=UPI00232F84AD|nr:glycerophosphodiester phosphodiesterase family protein [Pectobacterium sp. A5351]WCG82492.1 glycerophosphodiester phosphodiesterase family protein [Pectobacterium sp. A5351]
MLKYIRTLLLIITTAFVVTHAYADNYDPSKVIGQMRVVNKKLKFVIAHRGLYGRGVAENSIASIKAAADKGIEAVELDVKPSRNNTLWLFHDLTVGRATNYGYPSAFDPFSPNVGKNSELNPPVNTLTDSQLNALKVKDIIGFILPTYALRLEDVFAVAEQDFPNMVFILDIKNANDVGQAAFQSQKANMADRVILKFSVSAILPDQVTRYTNGQPFVPTVYTGDLNAIVNEYRKEHPRRGAPVNAKLIVQDYLDKYTQQKGFVYFELGMKTWPDGPLGSYAYHLHNLGVPIGNFSPVPEARNGYFRSNGTCCASLNDYLTPSPYFGNETVDNRTSLRSMVDFFDNVLTDAASDAVSYADSSGYRSDKYKILR